MVGGPIWMLKKFFGLIWFVSLLIQIGLVVAYFQFFRSGAEAVPAEVPIPVVVADAIEAVVKQVPSALPESEVELRPTLVMPLKDDSEKAVTTALRRALSKDGRYRSVDMKPGVIDRILANFRSGKKDVTDPAEAVKLAEDSDAKVVIVGRVEKLKTKSGVVEISLEMYQVDDKAKIFSGSFRSDKQPEPAEVPTPVSNTSSPKNRWLYAGLACFAIFWPLLLMPAMRRTLRAENNAMTAAVLALTILVPLAIGWTGIFAGDWGIWSIVMFLVGGAAVALWTIFVMNRVAEAEAY